MPEPLSRFRREWNRFRQIQREMWQTSGEHGRGGMVQFMRVVAIAYRGVIENQLFSRAAALSYSSLLALAPVLGVVVLLVGTFMKGDPEVRIKQALLFAVPTLEEYINLSTEAVDPGKGLAPTAPKQTDAVASENGQQPDTDPEPLPANVTDEEMSTALDVLIARMMEGVNQTISGVNSGGGGLAASIGGLILIWVGISLLVAVEGAFNDIWGVREGRTWGSRIVIYWAVLSLGALLGFALIGFLSASTVAGVIDALPIAGNFTALLAIAGPLISFLGLTIMLTVFYKFFPNTHVRTKPALMGGVVVAMLLVLNNLFSIIYINRVIQAQSLYGSLGIILVLMFGLYVFWVFLLLGGQITYAVQNVSFLANQRAWSNVSARTRETITFAAFIIVCRRFAATMTPLSADEIADMIRVPNNIVNESLTRLTHLDLIMPVRGREEESERSCYVPSRPLKKITLASFKRAYACEGSNEGTDVVRKADPLVDFFRTRIDALEDGELAGKSVDDLLDEHPTDTPLRRSEQKAVQQADA